jgi:hypothetical protein
LIGCEMIAPIRRHINANHLLAFRGIVFILYKFKDATVLKLKGK